MKRRAGAPLGVLIVLAGAFLGLSRGSDRPIIFTDVTRGVGIAFLNSASPEKRYIVESVPGGVALFDFDGDGRLDIYLVNSYTVEAALAGRPRPPAALYRNRGNGTFEEVAEEAGLHDPGWAMGVAVADYDNDGRDDLYVTCFGPNRLYRNRGNGTFEDVTDRSGVRHSSFSTGAAWGDYDRDGHLDLFVSGYVGFQLHQLPEFGRGPLCQYRGVPVQCGPRGLEGAEDRLYRNNGDGTFTDVTVRTGVEDRLRYYGLGVVWTDLNDDGWPDLFIANDATPNFAYLNNRNGTFSERGFELGLAVSENGVEQGSMGIAVGDYDRDGRLDIFVTNFSDEYNTLYRKNADGTFTDMSRASKTADASFPYVGWGTRFIDYDNDGWADLFVANGHVYPQVEGAYPGGYYRQPKLFYRNLRNGTFEEISLALGPTLRERSASRGAAFGDIDQDGDIDIVINDLDGPPMLLRNEGGSKAGHWIRLRLSGTKSNRNAVGALVRVRTADLVQVDEVRSGDSYLSHSEWTMHFGLGSATVVDEISIRWPSGQSQTLRKVRADQVLEIREE